MSQNYASALSKYPNKGVLGLPEIPDTESALHRKVLQLVEMVRSARHIVVHTGAGISTAAGISDFRGPNGVWTLEKKKMALPPCIPFNDAIPTFTHMALKQLVDLGIVKFVVSQNIDGLHVRSGLCRNNLAELHGDMFLDECRRCRKLYLRNTPSTTVGQKPSGVFCENVRATGRKCRGAVVDSVLDWCNALPEADLAAAEAHSKASDLNIVLGSTLQIVPSGELPMRRKTLDNNAKFVICNLQKTKFDSDADLVIRAKVDSIFTLLMEHLAIAVPAYSHEVDPVRLILLPSLHSTFDKFPVYPPPEPYAGDVPAKPDQIKRKYSESKTSSSKIRKNETEAQQTPPTSYDLSVADHSAWKSEPASTRNLKREEKDC